ncbi:N(4)-(beta-N-acetylglucosaminyl)-L-asparaginase [Leptotrichia sp. OH3620_COT-345]|uniref:N(4)-(beta-N-acetylglucosaminyl)-L-asparaginase n=1 Tax=Leptotrichia sp. OH3620_COT-345 TaxID=2491048 RepID=UPI000F64691D|nr:N(4)-(beta-N-acetylglucosaminyl)-L-asparaginase [Leptotrichia sp. OH3620_COT-345]RRD39453.1 N(4)-(beta-N-acetylglucosaminyl)-L-asparaginase [Leptotrichia sp. OH3620_COT-345]
MWGIIATWCMARDGVEKATKMLKNKEKAENAVEIAIKDVEDFPYYKSVGYGGLPNEEMEVELDAAYMDGSTFNFGAVCAIKDFANPISVAKKLSKLSENNMLVSSGAEAYAHKEGFERKNMLTDRAKIHYKNRIKDIAEYELKPYSGHDTVGMVCLDVYGNMVSGTSTSGLFMKKRGRIGDSPIIGSGLYVDNEVGGASATGLGEDIMKGIISYEIVRMMETGADPQTACDRTVYNFERKMMKKRGKIGDISVVAMNNKGEWGVSTNIDNFSFVVANELSDIKIYRAKRINGKTICELASKEWIEEYMSKRMEPLEEK